MALDGLRLFLAIFLMIGNIYSRNRWGIVTNPDKKTIYYSFIFQDLELTRVRQGCSCPRSSMTRQSHSQSQTFGWTSYHQWSLAFPGPNHTRSSSPPSSTNCRGARHGHNPSRCEKMTEQSNHSILCHKCGICGGSWQRDCYSPIM